MKSVEEKVEEYFKELLKSNGIRTYIKNENMRYDIDRALKEADSKSGGNGGNYPDIKFILCNSYQVSLPVMVEAKGSRNRLEKIDKDGSIDMSVKSVQNYAVNGAMHYGMALLEEESIPAVLVIGINGTEIDESGNLVDPEYKVYFLSKRNHKIPRLVSLDENWSAFKTNNIDNFFDDLLKLNLSEKELEANRKKAENNLEEKVQAIHQTIYEDLRLRHTLGTNEKLYLFCGLIMAGLSTKGVHALSVNDFYGNDNEFNNDGTIIIHSIESFLSAKDTSREKTEMIVSLLSDVFKKPVLWKPNKKGVSIIKEFYQKIKDDIIPLLESGWRLDFMGKILDRLSDWASIENDKLNDVVLTPRYITRFMARLAQTNMDSYVWDRAMGSGGFLVSAMDIMIADAKAKIIDSEKLENKIANIKKNQLLGVEILGNIYILAALNMILMGDGSSKILNEDSHKDLEEYHNFPATVFLLNPPYSAPGKGFNFVEETLEQMTEGYAAILIQENAGSGQGLPYTKNILKKNTLVASIHMPADLFGGKASVQAAIYLFQVARPHEEDDLVTFVDMSEDGYARQNRKKSSQKVNLRDVDDAQGRYDEIVAKLAGKKAKTNYYTEENGLLIKDTISLKGADWCYNQHKKVNLEVTREDMMKTVSDYLSWKVGTIMKGQINTDV